MILVLIIIPLVILIPNLGSFLFAPGAQYSDLLVTHLPNAEWIRYSILNWHEIPLWNNQILSGYPFFANPLSGLYYPFGWPAVFLPAPTSFNLLAGLHIVWGGFGMYWYLRGMDLNKYASYFGAIGFQLMPKLWAHYAAGHISLIYAICWTPWLLASSQRATSEKRFPFWPAMIFALIILADVRWSAYAGFIWAADTLWNAIRNRTQQQDTRSINSTNRPDIKSSNHPIMLGGIANLGMTLLPAIGQIFRQSILALFMSAPFLIPFVEYTRLSTRITMTVGDTNVFSFPFERLVGFFFADPGGFAEWTVYPLATLLALAFYAVTARRNWSRISFWGLMTITALLLSFGTETILGRIAATMPGLDLLRVPSRWLFVSQLGIIVLAATGANELFNNTKAVSDFSRSSILIIFALMLFSIIFSLAFIITTNQLGFGILWGGGCLTLASLLILLRLQTKISMVLIAVIMSLLLVIDGIIVVTKSFEPRSEATVYREGSDAAAYLWVQGDDFRAYSPSYSLPQQIVSRYQLEVVEGVDPLQLKTYSNYFERASGVEVEGYSVTLPPFASGNPDSDNRDSHPDADMLGRLNVRYIVSAFELPENQLILRARFGNTRVYENSRVAPRAWVQTGDDIYEQILSEAIVEMRTANSLVIRAKGPGYIVLSELFYPGWKVKVDGIEKKVLPVANLLRSVPLREGLHKIEFNFEPTSLKIGFGLLIAAIFLIIFNTVWMVFKK